MNRITKNIALLVFIYAIRLITLNDLTREKEEKKNINHQGARRYTKDQILRLCPPSCFLIDRVSGLPFFAFVVKFLKMLFSLIRLPFYFTFYNVTIWAGL
jgi:hypothetical protein